MVVILWGVLTACGLVSQIGEVIRSFLDKNIGNILIYFALPGWCNLFKGKLIDNGVNLGQKFAEGSQEAIANENMFTSESTMNGSISFFMYALKAINNPLLRASISRFGAPGVALSTIFLYLSQVGIQHT